jgi:glutamyl-tRNA synthetase
LLQSTRLDQHRAAIERLLREGKAYPCVCSRKEIDLAASAPHAEDGSAIYPGTCRGRFESVESARTESGREPAIRFRVPSQPLRFDDQLCGPQSFEPESELGDFVIAKSDGTPAYQLAVVVDDSAAGVTHIVRGDDLIDSTPRQMLLYRALGLEQDIPSYWHLPLVRGEDGKRLAKRHGDTRLSSYRAAGTTQARVLRLLARWCGATIDQDRQATVAHLLERFRLDNLPRSPIIFTRHDDRFLHDR